MRRVLLAAVPILILAACGDDDDDDTLGTVPVAASLPGSDVVTVVATDYKYSGLPATVPAGTRFVLQNDSDHEAHEMIVIRIPDDEDRTIGQLAALPEDEADAVFADVAPATVIVALPGEEGVPVEGDGTVTEPGRYAVVCFLPKDGDADVLRAAMESETEPTGPPDMGTGPPHVTQGMYAETVVE